MRLLMPVLMVAGALLMAGCDQQQPITQKPPAEPGFKDGETPPVEPERGGKDAQPLPPATTPALPNDPNRPHPGAPLPPATAPAQTGS